MDRQSCHVCRSGMPVTTLQVTQHQYKKQTNNADQYFISPLSPPRDELAAFCQSLQPRHGVLGFITDNLHCGDGTWLLD